MARQDVGPGAQAALTDLAKARRNSREELMKARIEVDNANQAAVGESPLSYAHSAVFSFYDAARPYRNGAPELWKRQPIGTFTLQVPGRGRTRVTLDGLEDASDWRNRDINLTRSQQSGRPNRNKRAVNDTWRLWLPLNILQAIHDTIADALVRANLAAQLPDTEEGGEPV